MTFLSERPGISLDEWYPLVRDVVPAPDTAWRRGLDLMPLAYGDEADPDGALAAEYERVSRWIIDAVPLLGGYPVFLRSGHTSGKHEWPRTCYLERAEDVRSHVYAICEYSALADFVGLPANVWVVREMLPTEPAFHAFGGMPITRERRYFVDDDRILGHHPYWPPDAFEWDPAPGWRQLLDALNEETPEEVAELTALTLLVGAAVPGAWSVDWLWSRDRWYLTDMAWAEESFVWQDYPSAPAPFVSSG